MCGEKPDILPLSAWTRGSPPRMRGKENPETLRDGNSGITPAYAGKRFSNLYWWCRGWDHPRVCGEKRQKFLQMGGQQGSPPRMRGKASSPSRWILGTRITPAYAGKSFNLYALTTAFWDHPRVCGEKLRCCMRWQIRRGSPPRMRGKDAKVLIMLPLRGITPAYAGKRPCTRYSQKGTRDHPRVCGEKSTGHVKPFGRTGSPPRMRGKVKKPFTINALPRITPAYAGKRKSMNASSITG